VIGFPAREVGPVGEGNDAVPVLDVHRCAVPDDAHAPLVEPGPRAVRHARLALEGRPAPGLVDVFALHGPEAFLEQKRVHVRDPLVESATSYQCGFTVSIGMRW